MMEPMAGHRHQRGRKATAASVAALAVGVMLILASCGGSTERTAEAAPATSPAPTIADPAITTTTPTADSTTSTIEPTTTAPATSASTTTSIAPSTTTSTTTAVPLSTIALEHAQPVATQTEPIAPPTDSHAAEPVIELGTISIPKFGVEMNMFEGIRLTTLDRGPGHWPGSALPGQQGNVVVGGHRVSKHQVFRNVDQLVAGDEIIFTDATGTHVYAVDRVESIEPTEVWIVDPTETPTASLFACLPPGSTSQRIAVFADLVG
jgi:sortase A